VSAEVQGNTAIFAVADNGIGMDPGQAERIFQPFARLHGEDEYPGTGIGLAVCERIIEQHGGRIWAQSAPGQGSTFRFTLPVAGRRRSSVPSFDGGVGA
jgi:signal transduction histidine kinase